MRFERGGFALGVIVGLLVGLALALGVALYITKAPVPFVNKVPQRTPEQDQAEIERNKHWDPNAPLAGRSSRTAPAAAASGAGPTAGSTPPLATAPAAGTVPAPAPAAATSPGAPRDPAAILAGAAPGAAAPAPPAPPVARGADPFVYFVQAGAYTRMEEAEQQRARLAMAGQAAKITEREQQGRTVYRVRLGPFNQRGEADALLGRLHEVNVEGQIVRVERP